MHITHEFRKKPYENFIKKFIYNWSLENKNLKFPFFDKEEHTKYMNFITYIYLYMKGLIYLTVSY